MSDFFAENPDLKDKIFPSAFGAATVDGKLYAMPIETVAPIVLFWNKKIFDQVGAGAPAVVGRHHGPRPQVQRQGDRPVLAGGAVAVDEHDVAGVPLRPHRRSRGLPGRLRRREERLEQPCVAEGAGRGAEAGQGQRLPEGLPVHGRRPERRPGAALHRQGRHDAARRMDLRVDEGPRRRLRHRWQPGLHELPAGRRRQGRPQGHRRQPGSVRLHLVQGLEGGQGRRHEDALHHDARRHRGQEVDRHRQHPGREVRERPDRCGDRQERQGVAAVRLRHLEPGLRVRAVVGPGAAARAGHAAAGQHRQAVPAEHQPRSSSPTT